MKCALLLGLAVGWSGPLCEVALAEQPVPQPIRVARHAPAAGNPAISRKDELRALLDGLARQIDEINANVVNLGPSNAAAVRFRTVSLAAYQRAWAELTRDDVDLGGATAEELVATLVRSQP